MASEIRENDKPEGKGSAEGPSESSVTPIETARGPVAQPLRLLEAKISEVQSKWHAVEKQLGHKDRTIVELRKELDARTAVIKRLEAMLAATVRAKASADDTTAATEAELAHLEAQLNEQTDLLANNEGKLTEATGRYQALRLELDSAYGQIEALREDLERQQHEEPEPARQHGESFYTDETLQHAVHDLERYMEARAEEQADQPGRVVNYSDAVARLEQRLREQETLIEARNREKVELNARNRELEHLCAERDATIQSLSQELDDHVAQLERVRAEAASFQDKLDDLEETIATQLEQIEELEQQVARRDASIKGLRQALDSESRLSADLEAQLDEQSERVQAAEARLVEKIDEAGRLEAQLGSLRQRVTQAESELASRDAEMANLERTASRTAEALKIATTNLDRAVQETDKLRAELNEALALNAELEQAVSSTQIDRSVFEAEFGAQQLLINELEGDLEKQQQTLRMLDSSVERIAQLAASLDKLDREMTGVAVEPAAEQIDDEIQAAEQDQPCIVWAGGRFPLDKPETTIGRAKKNDICVDSLFTSRFHARVLLLPTGEVILEDHGSRNGVRVNGVKIHRHSLQDGDKIRIGERDLIFVAAQENPAPEWFQGPVS